MKFDNIRHELRATMEDRLNSLPEGALEKIDKILKKHRLTLGSPLGKLPGLKSNNYKTEFIKKHGINPSKEAAIDAMAEIKAIFLSGVDQFIKHREGGKRLEKYIAFQFAYSNEYDTTLLMFADYMCSFGVGKHLELNTKSVVFILLTKGIQAAEFYKWLESKVHDRGEIKNVHFNLHHSVNSNHVKDLFQQLLDRALIKSTFNDFRCAFRLSDFDKRLLNVKLSAEERRQILKVPRPMKIDDRLLKAFKPINWVGTQEQLFYLIRTLVEKGIIINKNYWQITAVCFIVKGERIQSSIFEGTRKSKIEFDNLWERMPACK